MKNDWGVGVSENVIRGEGPKKKLWGGLDLQHPNPPTILHGTALIIFYSILFSVSFNGVQKYIMPGPLLQLLDIFVVWLANTVFMYALGFYIGLLGNLWLRLMHCFISHLLKSSLKRRFLLFITYTARYPFSREILSSLKWNSPNLENVRR